MKFGLQIIIPLITATYVSAHGYVATLTIDGKAYKGDVPNGPTDPSVVRQISTTSPVKGANNPFINCGQNAKVASLNAAANPGSEILFQWDAGQGENWPHNTGPMLTYMASCGQSTCDKFDSSKAKWFKIQQVGRVNGGAWAQADLMKGAPAKITLPSTLAPGNYMIRHEIIALHLATSMGGAEFYPSCSQLTVGGNQKGAPSNDELVSLPGAYSDNDPGIYDPDVYNPGSSYTFPGPPIAKFVNDDASGSSDSGNDSDPPNAGPSSSPSSSQSASDPSSTTAPGSGSGSGSGPGTGTSSGSSSGSCRLRRKSPSGALSRRSATYKPRHISRIMRGLVFGNSH